MDLSSLEQLVGVAIRWIIEVSDRQPGSYFSYLFPIRDPVTEWPCSLDTPNPKQVAEQDADHHTNYNVKYRPNRY